jgi:hypothetical protein
LASAVLPFVHAPQAQASRRVSVWLQIVFVFLVMATLRLLSVRLSDTHRSAREDKQVKGDWPIGNC